MAWKYLKENPRVVPLLAFYKLERWLTPITVSGGLVRLLVITSCGCCCYSWRLVVFGGSITDPWNSILY